MLYNHDSFLSKLSVMRIKYRLRFKKLNTMLQPEKYSEDYMKIRNYVKINHEIIIISKFFSRCGGGKHLES